MIGLKTNSRVFFSGVDNGAKVLRAFCMMFALSGVQSGTPQAFAKGFHVMRALCNVTFLLLDQQRVQEALYQQAKKSDLLNVSQENVVVFRRLFKGGRDTLRVISLFAGNKEIEKMNHLLARGVRLLSTTKAILTVQADQTGQNPIPYLRALGSLTKKAFHLSFMPQVKAFKWIALSITATSGIFGRVSHVQTIQKKEMP